MIVVLLASLSFGADAITFDGVRVVEFGTAHPYLDFHPTIDGSIEVELTCGPKKYTLNSAIRPNSPVRLNMDALPEGSWHCTGRLTLHTADGGVGSMPLSLDVAALSIIEWTYGMDDVDLDARTLRAHPSRPLEAAQVQVLGPGGSVVDTAIADLSDPLNPSFAWTSTAEAVKLVIEGRDTHGFTSQLELSPWSYQIPHEDVVFASGQHTISADEGPKLEVTWADTVDVLDKYGSVVVIQLFVGGYTDTVGAAGSNQGLSERRARAIAQWFKGKGFPGQIWYQGFGEEGLAVRTPDETDEPRNRRAVYLLSAEKPPINPELPRSNWKAL